MGDAKNLSRGIRRPVFSRFYRPVCKISTQCNTDYFCLLFLLTIFDKIFCRTKLGVHYSFSFGDNFWSVI